MTDSTVETPDPASWIGRRRTSKDRITLRTAHFMQQTMDLEPDLEPGAPLPLAWHWLYFLETARTSESGRDGHPLRGGFLPPVSLPRRMWAGSRLEFHAPIRIGDTVVRNSEIRSVVNKEGRSGKLCFVTVNHSYDCDGRQLLSEEHDIVYREDPVSGSQMREPAGPKSPLAQQNLITERLVEPSASLLFRYSALTFNTHRIHYDVDYCRQVEGYPGLVVHGPLIATLLLDLLVAEFGQDNVQRFRFRAISPLFADRPFHLNLGSSDTGYRLWATNANGNVAVEASAELKTST